MKIYRCKHCGNIVLHLHDERTKVSCCGDFMEELVACSTDAAVEKHVPSVKVKGSEVDVVVGDVVHPMTPEHFIEFIILETDKGFQERRLSANCEPKASFKLAENEKVIAVYEYCNLHGLWKKEL